VARVEVDRSPPSIAEVKCAWRYNSTPPYAFIAFVGMYLPTNSIDSSGTCIVNVRNPVYCCCYNICLNDICYFDHDKVTFCLQTLH
jgi:hypothetical protein